MADDFDMMACFEEMENNTSESRDKIIRAPFAWPGGKQRSINEIVPRLPYTSRYVEVCGGGGSILINRRPSKMEVFNDRNAGITAFYRCIRDPIKFEKLCERLEITIHSREEFVWCKETWENYEDDVERAARWYYMVTYSFGSLGRNFGRTLKPNVKMAGRIQERLEYFWEIHQRFKGVQVENLDWSDCMVDYDHPETVFYVDPDYLGTSKGVYKHSWTPEMHKSLLEMVFTRLKGFVAISGVANTLYDTYPWSRKYSWDVFRSIKSVTGDENNKKSHLGIEDRGNDTEVLYVKEPA